MLIRAKKLPVADSRLGALMAVVHFDKSEISSWLIGSYITQPEIC